MVKDEFLGRVRHVAEAGEVRVVIEMRDDAIDLDDGEWVIVRRANEQDPAAPIPFRITPKGLGMLAA